MLSATVKTLKVYTGIKEAQQHFDDNGALYKASLVFDYYPEEIESIDIYSHDKAIHASDFIYEPMYAGISEKRLGYLRKIKELCEEHDASLIVYITPLYGELLQDIYSDENLNERMTEFKRRLAYITDYYDFLTMNDITRSAKYFGDTSHLKTSTGNLVLARIFGDNDVDMPNGFGVFIKNDIRP